MLVLIHLEWLNSMGVDPYPTQLAALRVDAQWGITDRFETLIFQPIEPSSWKHEAYGGIDAKEYHRAPDLCQVEAAFRRWLRPKDVCCWWSIETGNALHDYLHFTWKNNRALCNRFIGIVMDRMAVNGSPYRLAQQRGIRCPQPMHVAVNAVETLRRLLQRTRIDPKLLLTPQLPSTNDLQKMRLKVLPYWYDKDTMMVHSVGCKLFMSDEEVRRSAVLDLALYRHVPVCSCCLDEYRKAAVARNAEIMGEESCLYVYSPDSQVFHRAGCCIARRICRTELVSETSYKRCVESGRRRCRVCRPVRLKPPIQLGPPSPKPMPVPAKKEKSVSTRAVSVSSGHLKKDAQMAVQRYQQARSESIPNKPMSSEERADWRTLTQSTHAFFAARGYGNFHMRNCPRLRGLTGIQGFSTFKQALANELTPCRYCKPSVKQELKVAIPVQSRLRTNETPDLLDKLCKRAGYRHKYEPPYYYITTHVGKWRLKVNERPVRLYHINLMRSTTEGEYHLQPRMFLSLRDTFEYIRRHDERLGKTRNRISQVTM